MNMDMLSRGFDILQRAGGMEQISQLLVIVYGAVSYTHLTLPTN